MDTFGAFGKKRAPIVVGATQSGLDRLTPPSIAEINAWRSRFGNAKPGDPGFNDVVYRVMTKHKLRFGDGLSTNCESKSGFAHQNTASWLVGPETPINRLLVVHRTGSGKTDIMCRIVDEYYFDPRPKIVIVPNTELVNNFFTKFYSSDTRYNVFAEMVAQREQRPNTFARFKELITMDGLLSTRGRHGELYAPIRPIRYNIAGGSSVTAPRGPKLPIFKIGYDSSTRNPYDNKIIVMDEVHNLVQPKEGTSARDAKKLAVLRDLLFSAKNSVLVGLTATPMVKSIQDGDELIKIIKGAEYANTQTNEGFISYFNSLPTTIYPNSLPGISAVQLVRIALIGANKARYKEKLAETSLTNNPTQLVKQLMHLMNYCNTWAYYTQANNPEYVANVKAHPEQFACKLNVIADEVVKYPHKCAIIIDHKLGFKALKNLIAMKDPMQGKGFLFMDKPKNMTEQDHNPLLELFNDKKTNGRGELYKCLVIEAETYGEGIDLIGVRRFILAHPPSSYAAYKQWTGRVFRACGDNYLPEDERNVYIEMYCAKMENGKTADEYMLDLLLTETHAMEAALSRKFADVASDKRALGN